MSRRRVREKFAICDHVECRMQGLPAETSNNYVAPKTLQTTELGQTKYDSLVTKLIIIGTSPIRAKRMYVLGQPHRH